MLLATIKRYWITAVGIALIATITVVSAHFIGQRTIESLLETQMKERADTFGAFLLSSQGELDAFLVGIGRDVEGEANVRRVANLSGIDSFAIFDRHGTEVFRTRSDRYEWLLRDRPGGISAGDRLSESALSRDGLWHVINNENETLSTVLMPLIRGGKTVGYLSLSVDMAGARGQIQYALAREAMSLVLVVGLATGLPLMIYLRRKRKIADAAEQIHFLANHDPLTGFFNRTRMQEETDRQLASSRATRERMAYLYVDLDDLSDVNNEMGQATGDELLRVIANRIAAASDRGDVQARIGADDFALLHRRIQSKHDVTAFAGRLIEAVCEPVEVSGRVIHPRVSIGCAVAPEDGRTHAELLKRAEIAHLNHKSTKSGALVFYDVAMDEAAQRRRQIEALVRDAVDNKAFELHYQPIVDGSGGILLGFEALLRLRDHEGNLVPPGVFVPIAEARGYIKPIGTWVIEEAARQIACWPEDLFVSVNLSAVQFEDGDIVDIVSRALSDAGIPGRRLEIEIVESIVMQRSEMILSQLEGLKALGVSIDMDDFGTGYSSLGYLWRFSFDKLKIDQSFMVALDNGEANVPQILGTIVSLAHQMDMKVTVEGVETTAQAELMRQLGCDQLQGYLFGKPMPATTVAAELLSSFSSRIETHPVLSETAGTVPSAKSKTKASA